MLASRSSRSRLGRAKLALLHLVLPLVRADRTLFAQLSDPYIAARAALELPSFVLLLPGFQTTESKAAFA